MMVIYEGVDETLICTPSHEDALVKEYFTEGGRSLEDYDRQVVEGTVEITSRMHVSPDRVIA